MTLRRRRPLRKANPPRALRGTARPRTALGAAWAAPGSVTAAIAVYAVFAPASMGLVFLPKILFPMATYFLVAAVIAFARRSPDAPTRWKDIARPILAGVIVLFGMLSAVHPLWALGGVMGAGMATWVGLAGGFWDSGLPQGSTRTK